MRVLVSNRCILKDLPLPLGVLRFKYPNLDIVIKENFPGPTKVNDPSLFQYAIVRDPIEREITSMGLCGKRYTLATYAPHKYSPKLIVSGYMEREGTHTLKHLWDTVTFPYLGGKSFTELVSRVGAKKEKLEEIARVHFLKGVDRGYKQNSLISVSWLAKNLIQKELAFVKLRDWALGNTLNWAWGPEVLIVTEPTCYSVADLIENLGLPGDLASFIVLQRPDQNFYEVYSTHYPNFKDCVIHLEELTTTLSLSPEDVSTPLECLRVPLLQDAVLACEILVRQRSL